MKRFAYYLFAIITFVLFGNIYCHNEPIIYIDYNEGGIYTVRENISEKEYIKMANAFKECINFFGEYGWSGTAQTVYDPITRTGHYACILKTQGPLNPDYAMAEFQMLDACNYGIGVEGFGTKQQYPEQDSRMVRITDDGMKCPPSEIPIPNKTSSTYQYPAPVSPQYDQDKAERLAREAAHRKRTERFIEQMNARKRAEYNNSKCKPIIIEYALPDRGAHDLPSTEHYVHVIFEGMPVFENTYFHKQNKLIQTLSNMISGENIYDALYQLYDLDLLSNDVQYDERNINIYPLLNQYTPTILHYIKSMAQSIVTHFALLEQKCPDKAKMYANFRKDCLVHLIIYAVFATAQDVQFAVVDLHNLRMTHPHYLFEQLFNELKNECRWPAVHAFKHTEHRRNEFEKCFKVSNDTPVINWNSQDYKELRNAFLKRDYDFILDRYNTLHQQIEDKAQKSNYALIQRAAHEIEHNLKQCKKSIPQLQEERKQKIEREEQLKKEQFEALKKQIEEKYQVVQKEQEQKQKAEQESQENVSNDLLDAINQKIEALAEPEQADLPGYRPVELDKKTIDIINDIGIDAAAFEQLPIAVEFHQAHMRFMHDLNWHTHRGLEEQSDIGKIMYAAGFEHTTFLAQLNKEGQLSCYAQHEERIRSTPELWIGTIKSVLCISKKFGCSMADSLLHEVTNPVQLTEKLVCGQIYFVGNCIGLVRKCFTASLTTLYNCATDIPGTCESIVTITQEITHVIKKMPHPDISRWVTSLSSITAHDIAQGVHDTMLNIEGNDVLIKGVAHFATEIMINHAGIKFWRGVYNTGVLSKGTKAVQDAIDGTKVGEIVNQINAKINNIRTNIKNIRQKGVSSSLSGEEKFANRLMEKCGLRVRKLKEITPKIMEETKDVECAQYVFKHVPSKDNWERIIESTKSSVAKFKPDINVEHITRFAWKHGELAKNGKNFKVIKFDEIIGAKWGKETCYMRVEMSANTIHGQPIPVDEFINLLRG